MAYYVTDPMQQVTWDDSIVQESSLPYGVACGTFTWTDDLPVDNVLFTKTDHLLSVQTNDFSYAGTTQTVQITVHK